MPLKKISEHLLVPRHEIVPQEKAGQVVERFGTEIKKLPKILKSDPAAEEIGAQKGDIIKITRTSPTAGKTVYYRTVI